MSFDTHMFYRPKCDYPGCENRWEGVEYDWSYDEFDATEEVTDSEDWVCLYDDDERPPGMPAAQQGTVRLLFRRFHPTTPARTGM